METVTHCALLLDPDTGDIHPAHQTGYDLNDVIMRVESATAPGSGNIFEGMIPIIDPFPVTLAN